MSHGLSDKPALVDSPAEAYQAQLALLHATVVEAVRRRQDELPGIVETAEDLLITSGTTQRKVYGWFAPDTWRYGDRNVHELFLNADSCHLHPGISRAEGFLVTSLHEVVHAYATANGVKDTSRDGRYHNRKFAEVALAIGLQIERDARIGHRTPRLTARGRYDYNDLLSRLESGLVLVRVPQLVRSTGGGTAATDNPDTPATKYVFASCQCQDVRHHLVTIRVAKGSWRLDAIHCSVCQSPFVESPTNR